MKVIYHKGRNHINNIEMLPVNNIQNGDGKYRRCFQIMYDELQQVFTLRKRNVLFHIITNPED